MRLDEDPRDAPAPLEATPRSSRHLLALFTFQDAIMLAYLAIVMILVWRTGVGPAQESVAGRLIACIAIVLVGCLWARAQGGFGLRSKWVLYRVALAGVLIENYLMLRDLLPLVRPDSVDAELLEVDLRLFGFEPAIWLERLNHRPIIEYFSFFYFSYFFILTTYLIVVVFLSKGGRQTTEFAIGTFIVFCVGQLGYMAVPAVGPIKYLASSYAGPIEGGFFWSCVTAAVDAGSALKDVFPSLHTAMPSWLTLFALRRASFDPRWRWPARLTGFFAMNIVVSTLVLRWHYAIDVVAGLALATSAALISRSMAAREEAWRAKHGLPAPFSFS